MKCKNNCKRCGCPTCCECGPLRPLKHLADAMFYMCKAMGPPRFVAFVGDMFMCEPVAMRDPVQTSAWWAWFDDAMPWVRQ